MYNMFKVTEALPPLPPISLKFLSKPETEGFYCPLYDVGLGHRFCFACPLGTKNYLPPEKLTAPFKRLPAPSFILPARQIKSCPYMSFFFWLAKNQIFGQICLLASRKS